jgi:hypothetical protein
MYRSIVLAVIVAVVDATGPDWLPEPWNDAVAETQALDLVLLLETGPPPRLSATVNNHTVVYDAVVDPIPACD